MTPSVVAIGKFDGCHLGHQRLLQRARAIADARGARAVAVTFDRHPNALFRPEDVPEIIVELDRKIELLQQYGADEVVVLPFTAQLAGESPEAFVQRVLVDSLQAIAVLVGKDFRFGHKAAGTVQTLEALGAEHGFAVETVADVPGPNGERVSSTRVRELIRSGDVATAATLLGRPVEYRGEVVHGHQRGRDLGFPTANVLVRPGTVAPADGIYAGWLNDLSTGQRYPAAISLGTNPTFDDVPDRVVEAHALDVSRDFYGHEVSVEFVGRLRGMVAFTGLEPLKQQIAADVAATRSALRI